MNRIDDEPVNAAERAYVQNAMLRRLIADNRVHPERRKPRPDPGQCANQHA